MKSKYNIIDALPCKINYYPKYFGFNNINANGKFVRLCILDTGVPQIKDHQIDLHKTCNFTQSKDVYDTHGHSTILTSFVNTKNHIKGLSIYADVYYGKIIDNDAAVANINSVVEAILWCIVKEVDVILMSFAVAVDHTGLKDAIKKAHNSGLCLIAASGDHSIKTKDVVFPAAYDEVFSVGHDTKVKYNQVINYNKKSFGMIMPYIEYYTYYLENKFAKCGGSSINAAIIASYACLLMHDLRIKGKNPKNPQLIYNNLCINANKK